LILKKYDVNVCTEFKWLRIEYEGALFNTVIINLRFHKKGKTFLTN
jgi:hypothetical protein